MRRARLRRIRVFIPPAMRLRARSPHQDLALRRRDEESKSMNHHVQRGQAIVETAIFIPLFLVLLYAVLYFGQVGVKQVRVQTAIRYGINTLPASTFKIEQK